MQPCLQNNNKHSSHRFFSNWGTVNPLTTDNECTRHATLAAHYQLAQSILKISFALAKKVGGFQHGVPCTWQLLWLAIEKPWSALAWPFLSFLTQTGVDKAPLPV